MIEADFMREYSMDLSFSINNISWRRFELLLDNLSINSNTVNIIQQRKEGKIAVVSSKARGNSIINQYL
jgi:hypothetical protein